MTRYFALIAGAFLASGCAPVVTTGAVADAPAAIAERTRLDEQAALGAELAYQAAALVAKTAIAAGYVDKAGAEKVRAADGRAYAALLAVRSAYLAGNADGYLSALDNSRAAVSAVLSLVKEAR